MNNLDNVFLLCAALFAGLSLLLISNVIVMTWKGITRRIRTRNRVRRRINSATYTR